MATRTHSRTGPSLLPQSRRKLSAAWQIGEDSRGKVGKGEARHRRRRQAELLQLLILHCVPQSKHNKTKHDSVGRETSSLNRPNLEPKWLEPSYEVVLLLLLLLLFLFLLLLLFWTRIDEDTMRYVHTMLRTNCASQCRVTWESDSRRLRHPGEPSTTKNSSSSRARKTGAQLRDNRRSAKNDAKCVKKPFTAAKNAKSSTILCCITECPPALAMNRN